MKGDFSRNTFDATRHYSSVRMQQGRVQVDADWNEQLAIEAHRDETTTRDVVGQSGVPMGAAGFRVVPTAAGLSAEEAALPGNASPPALAGAGDFLITAGRAYGGGWLVENETITHYAGQPGLPGAPLPAGAGTYFAYLDVWQRHLTALEEPTIREVALGGPDTATRTQTLWQLRLLRVGDLGDALHCLSNPAAWAALQVPPTGRLAARAEPDASADTPCVVPAGAGFRRLENQLYRVEVHRGGARGTATFKWSRDNAAVQAHWESQVGADLTVSAGGRDSYLSFAAGQWVELIDEERELRGEPGTLVRIASVAGRVLTLATATADGPTTLASFGRLPRVRRWDSLGVLQPNNDDWVDLEDGVQVRFSAGTYRSGDHWMIPARTATADVEWPREAGNPLDLAPHGIEHRLCKLAVLRFDGTNILSVSDCRNLFPPLTALSAFFYLGGDGQEALPVAVLDRPLRVGVANGSTPVAGARVRFTRVGPAGSLLAAAGAVEEPGAGAASRTVLTDAQGEAEVRLQLGAPGSPVTHEVLAEWLDVSGTARHLPIRFYARASIAAETWYDNTGCNALDGADTVQEAIDTLAEQAQIRMLGGDAQPIQRSSGPLTSALEVAVVSACGPVAGARVRFEPQGAGRAAATLAGLPASTGAVELLTDASGRAAAFWQPDPDPVPHVQQLRARLLNAGTRRIQAPAEVVFTALRGAERCHDFLDELRSDGVVRDPATGVLGLRASFDPGNVLRIFYTAGVAYVAGCRWRIAAGSVTVAAATGTQLVYVDMEGQVRVGGTLPRALARLAEVHVAGGDVVQVVDLRRDLTHLDERVDLVDQNAAQRRIDRRAGIPLLASTLPGIAARDLRNHETPAPGVFGMAFDGQDMWAASQFGGAFRLAGRGPLGDSGAVTPVSLGAPVLAVAYDGVANLWFSSAQADRLFVVDRNTLRVTQVASAGTPFPLALGAGMMWVGNFGAGTVSAFDIGTLQLRFTVNLVPSNGAAPQALAFDGTAMWVGCSNGRLLRVSAQGAVELSLGFNDIGIRGLAFDGATLWLVTGQLFTTNGQVDRVDVLTGQRPQGPAVFSGDELLCDGSLMWVYDALQSDAAGFQAGMARRDCTTGTTLGSLPLNQALSAWAFDGTHIWAALRANNASPETIRVRKILAV